MSPSAIALGIFAAMLAGAILGMWLRSSLPEHHLSVGTMDVVKLATGLIGTLSALVLGLMISSAKGSFDSINNSLIENAARVVILDHALESYGPDVAPLRKALRSEYAIRVQALSSESVEQLTQLDAPHVRTEMERIMLHIGKLDPRDDSQRAAKARALQIVEDIAGARQLLKLHMHGSISLPLLIVLASWLVLIFTSFGLIGASNHTVLVALVFGAAAASGAIFLILEMDQPFGGLITINSKPLLEAVSHLGN